MMIREILGRSAALQYGRGRQTDRLAAGHVAPAFPVTYKELWIERPCDDGRDQKVVLIIQIVRRVYGDELALANRLARPDINDY